MSGTFCGNTCLDCRDREALGCPGCKNGPGAVGGECELARCCRGKSHETCETCLDNGHCILLERRSLQGQYRLKQREAQALRAQEADRRAGVMGKWLWILFWLVIAGTVVGLLANVPGLELIVALVTMGFKIGYGVVLLQLLGEDPAYKTAGICTVAMAVMSVFTDLLPADMAALSLIVAVAVAAVGLVGVYNELMAHSRVVGSADATLGLKWKKLWKWEIITIGCTLGGAVLAILSPLLGGLAVLGGATITLVVAVLNISYLYYSAKLFRRRKK